MYPETADRKTTPSFAQAQEKSDKLLISTLLSQSQSLPPFQRGLLWGGIFTITAAMSAALGAAVTLFTPLHLNLTPVLEQVQSWVKQAPAKTEVTSKAPVVPQGKKEQKAVNSPYRLSRPLQLLVMGIEPVPHAEPGSPEAFAGRNDTLLLVRFEPADNSLRLLSIPRDTRVVTPDLGRVKLDEINVTGGPALTARVVSKTLQDVPIDRYVRLTADGFQELVNLVGGVDVFVPSAMSYTDRTQNLKINLEAGWQTLKGEQAEQFIRFQDEKDGDLGRIQRQQILLKALLKRLQNPELLPKLPQAVRILQQYVDTNLSLEEMLALAYFSQGVSAEGLKMVILPGQLSRYSGNWLIAANGRDRVMRQYFALESDADLAMEETSASPQPLRIAIENATSDPSLGSRFASYLSQQNFNNVYLVAENAPQILQETEIIAQQGDLAAADLVQGILGLGRVEASSTGALDSDLTIRLGEDIKQKGIENLSRVGF